MRKTFGCAAVALSGAALLAAGAWAETAQDDTVLGRPRPDYTPVGIELGGGGLFTLFPKVTTGMLYDTNIFRQGAHRTGDVAVTVQPEVRLVSDWDAHALSAGVFGNIARYFHHQKANFADWGGSADGRLDITDDTDATGFVEYARLHEDRGDPDSAGRNQKTIQFDRFTRRLGLDFKGSPIFARTTGEWTSFNYYNNDGTSTITTATMTSTRPASGSARTSPPPSPPSSSPATIGASTTAATISDSTMIRTATTCASAPPTT